MKALATLALVLLLAACNGPTSSTSPTPSATPVAASTACPAVGKASAAVLPAATLGTHPTIFYTDEPAANGGPVADSLVRYDVTIASKTEILKTVMSEAQVSPNGQWIALATQVDGHAALQLVRTDGKYLQTLLCAPTNGSVRGIVWSPDQKSLLFSASSGSGAPPIYLLDLRSGKLQTEVRNNSLSLDYAPVSWLDGSRLLVVGRPLGPEPGRELRVLDVSRGANQQASDLALLVTSAAQCWDADNAGATIYISECKGAFSDVGGGTMRGPSTISAQPATDGQKQVVFTHPKLAVTGLRAAGSNQLLLSVGNQEPGNSSATSMNGLWRVNTDGSGLTRLLASSAGQQGQFAVYSQAPWATVSRDASLYAFQVSGAAKPPSYSLVLGPIAGGPATTFASRADGGLLLVVGWTTS